MINKRRQTQKSTNWIISFIKNNRKARLKRPGVDSTDILNIAWVNLLFKDDEILYTLLGFTYLLNPLNT